MTEYNNNKQLCSEVDKFIDEGRYDDALALLDGVLNEVADSDLFYRRGRLLWKLGRKTDAMSDYGRAVEIDPQSPAATALDMAREVMNFYNKDMYNP